MKNLSLILLFFIIFCAVKAQGNLQFNRGLTTTYVLTGVTTSNAPQTSTYTLTVPAGKIWKLESCSPSYSINSYPNYFYPTQSNYSLFVSIDQGVISSGSNLTTPIWLSAGSHTLMMYGTNGSGNTANYNALITGIEFNITQ